MTDRSGGSDRLFDGSEGGPIEGRSPELSAAIYVLAPKDSRRESIVAVLPEEITVSSFSDVAAFADALSNDIAVVLLSMTLSEETLRTAALRTIQDTNYARIGLLADERERAFETRVPHDEIFFRSSDRETFQNRVKRLYVRSYYEAALQRYYTLNVASQNRRAKLDEQAAEEDDRLQKLETSTELMKSHLRQFRQFLQPGDLEAILARNEHIEKMVTDLLRGEEDPTVVGLPRKCPDCGLEWDTWHGSELESGHEKIGADTWRCTGCGTVIGGNDPDNYRVS